MIEFEVFSDGSYKHECEPDVVYAGINIPVINERRRVSATNQVLVDAWSNGAEVLAACETIRILGEVADKLSDEQLRCTVYSDCVTVVNWFNGTWGSKKLIGQRFIQYARKALSEHHNLKVYMMYVPGHSGIDGNEGADATATGANGAIAEDRTDFMTEVLK